jgi:uncharacterized protein (DUF486 family)
MRVWFPGFKGGCRVILVLLVAILALLEYCLKVPVELVGDYDSQRGGKATAAAVALQKLA